MINKTNKYKTAEAWIGTNPKNRLTVDLGEDLHARFKSVVARNKSKMKPVVIKLIKSYIDKHEKDVTKEDSLLT